MAVEIHIPRFIYFSTQMRKCLIMLFYQCGDAFGG